MPFDEILSKYKRGTLHSGSGAKVTSKSQALAIAMKYRDHNDDKPSNSGRRKTKRAGFASLG